MKIFRAFDIRGDYPSQINSEVVYKIAQSYVKFLKPKTIAVGYDARDSSPELFKAVVKGLRSQSVDVVSIGLVTTPEFYYTLNVHKEFDGGIMITSSHSPLNTNGLKLCSRNAESIHIENGLKTIEHYFNTEEFKIKEEGKFKKHNVFKEYKKFILSKANKSKLRIGMDAGNLCGSLDYQILKKTCKLKGININIRKPKPYFIPNPLIEKNLDQIKKLVNRKKLDFGVFFDGDCDRVRFVDEKGNSIAADIMGAFLSDQLKNKIILKDQQCSRIVEDICKKNHNKCIKTRVGHSFVDSKMKKLKADFAMERSGHFYFKDFFYKDNALLTVVKVTNILNQYQKQFSEIIKPYQKYYHSGEINFITKNKSKIIEVIENKYKNYNISHFDGTKIETEDYWIHLRESKTEDLLRLNIETNTKEKLNKVKNEIINIINKLK